MSAILLRKKFPDKNILEIKDILYAQFFTTAY
jgi:hypothetical protein